MIMKVGPNPIGLCPYKKGKSGHTCTREAHHGEDEGRAGVTGL